MNLLDRNPGAFLALAFFVVYAVIGIEIAMWVIATPMAAFGTLALIAVIAAFIARSFEDLLGPDDVADRVPQARRAERSSSKTTPVVARRLGPVA